MLLSLITWHGMGFRTSCACDLFLARKLISLQRHFARKFTVEFLSAFLRAAFAEIWIVIPPHCYMIKRIAVKKITSLILFLFSAMAPAFATTPTRFSQKNFLLDSTSSARIGAGLGRLYAQPNRLQQRLAGIGGHCGDLCSSNWDICHRDTAVVARNRSQLLFAPTELTHAAIF